MWKYVQETGHFFGAHGQLLARGYAGRGPAKNDPDQQCIPAIGPLPRGFYSVQCAQNHPRLGPVSLTPDRNNHMCCRSEFFIHGDSTTDPGNASNGCIVLPRAAREAIDGSEDKRLQVVRSSVLVARAAAKAVGSRRRTSTRKGTPLPRTRSRRTSQGCLEVSGTIDLAQFWPDGEADADTTKVKVMVGANAFRFRKDDRSSFQVTHAFENATVKGKARRPPIDKKGRVTIRLQGIDAPELHYRPQAPRIKAKQPTPAQRKAFNAVTANFRQPLAETATVELAKFLEKAGSPVIACVVRSAVDEPSDVFDTYGRLVGDIYVKVGAEERRVNHWLAEAGWAQPGLYASMSDGEIMDLLLLADKARSTKAGLWKSATSNVTRFDATLVYRKHGSADPAKDRGPVIFPKIFRRLSTFSVCKEAKLLGGSLKKYLEVHPDGCYETLDFVTQGPTAATPRRLDEFVSAAGEFLVGAGDLVFQEKPSMVVDAAGKPARW